MKRFRWGIFGTGVVSAKFVAGLATARDAEASFVASRSLARAQRFAAGMGIARAIEGYAEAAAAGGVGGRRLPLLRHWKSHAIEAERGVSRSLKQQLVSWIRRREIYAQDKLLGIAEMVRALREGRSQPTPPDFLMHVNELTLLIQGAGPRGITTVPTTSFAPIEPLPEVANSRRDYRAGYRPRLLERVLGGIVETLHKS
jgi:hypothetical protein